MRISARVIVFCLVVMAAVAVPAQRAMASTIYLYTGNQFTQAFTFGYTTSDFISASFTYSLPLPANQSLTPSAAGLVAWTITDGHLTLTEANSTFEAGSPQFATNALGNISSWNFWVYTNPLGGGGFASGIGNWGGQSYDISGCGNAASGGHQLGCWNAYADNVPGTWQTQSVEDQVVPEPSTVLLSLGGLAMLALRGHVMRRRSAAPASH